jgi:hypothetical protein
MLLSISASIVPSSVGDYDSNAAFSYGGFMCTKGSSFLTQSLEEKEEDLNTQDAAKKFADLVMKRATDE